MLRLKSARKRAEVEKRGKTWWGSKARENIIGVKSMGKHANGERRRKTWVVSLYQIDRSDQRPVGYPRKNDLKMETFSDQNGPIKRYHFFIPFSNSLYKWNLLKRSGTMNLFVKIEWQILVCPTGQSRSPPEVFPNILAGINQKETFPSDFRPKIPESLAYWKAPHAKG